MDAFEAVRTVLAVRSYQDKPVPPDTVRRIVEAGWLTASSMNGQPWHFIVIQDRDTLRQLGSMARSGPYIAQAPLAVVVVMEKSKFAISDASRAIQSMVLAAWSEGVGSNWVGFEGLDAIKPLLAIPADLDVLAIIPFGYPAKTVGKGKKNRKPLSQVAHRERFDQPFNKTKAEERVPTLTGILETSLYVADPVRSALFYQSLFGFAPVVTSDRLIALAIKEGQLLLLFRKLASRAPGVQLPHDGDGNLHLAFSIPASELDAWRLRLGECGIPVEGEVTWDRGGRSIYFRDPDGHLLELGSPGIWANY